MTAYESHQENFSLENNKATRTMPIIDEYPCIPVIPKHGI